MDVFTRHSYYMDEALKFAAHPRRMANEIKRRIPEDVEYDTIVGSGLSGVLVVPGLAKALKKEWGVVRKEHELQGGASHAESLYEGTMGRRWILIDDFMCTGGTVRRVVRSVHTTFHASHEFMRQWDTEFVGLCEYSANRSTPWRPLSHLLGRESWVRVNGLEDVWTTAHRSPADPEDESPQAGRLRAVPSSQ